MYSAQGAVQLRTLDVNELSAKIIPGRENVLVIPARGSGFLGGFLQLKSALFGPKSRGCWSAALLTLYLNSAEALCYSARLLSPVDTPQHRRIAARESTPLVAHGTEGWVGARHAVAFTLPRCTLVSQRALPGRMLLPTQARRWRQTTSPPSPLLHWLRREAQIRVHLAWW